MDVNVYGRQLTADEIAAAQHRELVGGLWDEMGELQFEFLRCRGLAPSHRLADVGCGALRGGVRFIRYLDAGNYYGLDVNASLLEAGRRELAAAGLADKAAHLVADDRFALSRFGVQFDCAIAVSVFTHLPMNSIVRCLAETRAVLRAGGVFYASFFEAPGHPHLAPLPHSPGGIVTHYDADPYHYAFAQMQWMADAAGMAVELIGPWEHPRDQRMLAFRAAR
jgi:cyclopropane fatty-acyl-phospholipid synthase-like methyltransferase